MEDPMALERKQAIPDGVSPREFALYYFLFMLMGAGANWVFPTALAQEVPYFQDHLPEGLCIATYMNAFTSAGVVSMLLYVTLHARWGPFPYTTTVPCLLVLSTIGCFLSAGVYGISIDNVSVPLFLCCILGGTVGALSTVIMNPFMTQFHNSYISAARSGGSGLILLTALLSLAQNPGASHPRFTVAAYLSTFGLLLLLPLGAYHYLTTRGIGLRPADGPQGEGEGGGDAENNAQRDDQHVELTANPFHLSSPPPPSAFPEPKARLIEEPVCDARNPSSPWYYAPMDWLVCTAVSPALHAQRPYLRAALPYGLAVGWINFNTWGVMCALIPFAMDAVSRRGDGSMNLSVAYQVAALLLVAGDLSTTVVRLPLLPCLAAFSGLCATVYAAAGGGPGFDYGTSSAALVIAAYAVERFLEAHVVTSVYRAVATRFPRSTRQAAARVVGVCDQVSTTLGAGLATLVVALLFRCGGGDDDDT